MIGHHGKHETAWDVAIVLSHGKQAVPCVARNGITTACLQIAKHLKQRGFRTCLVMNLEDGQNSYLESIPVLSCCTGSFKSIANCITQNGGCRTLIENSSAGVFQHNVAEKHIVVMHNPHHLWGVETYGRSLYDLVQAIICVSDDSKAKNIEWGAPANLLTTIHNGCDSATFFPHSTNRIQRRLIFVGGCSWEKGLDLVLGAYEQLRQGPHENLELVVCGNQTSWSNSPERKRFQPRGWLDPSGFLNWDRIKSEHPRVYYRGVITGKELAVEYSQASFLVLPSRRETFGMVAIEAQACGCLPVLPMLGPFKETVVDGHTGFLYKDNTSASLASKLDELLRNRHLESSRQAAASHVRENFSWERAGDKYAELIESLPPLPRSARFKFRVTQFIKNLVSNAMRAPAR